MFIACLGSVTQASAGRANLLRPSLSSQPVIYKKHLLHSSWRQSLLFAVLATGRFLFISFSLWRRAFDRDLFQCSLVPHLCSVTLPFLLLPLLSLLPLLLVPICCIWRPRPFWFVWFARSFSNRASFSFSCVHMVTTETCIGPRPQSHVQIMATAPSRYRRGGVSAETYSEEDATTYVKKVCITFAPFLLSLVKSWLDDQFKARDQRVDQEHVLQSFGRHHGKWRETRSTGIDVIIALLF